MTLMPDKLWSLEMDWHVPLRVLFAAPKQDDDEMEYEASMGSTGEVLRSRPSFRAHHV